ncbi:MAG TPA: winged helix-turn-helix domain-containing protein [Rugosimonospora sp.]|nr:winged helix-turn-helix domain-containing protein [Rugosimonospora sp.]
MTRALATVRELTGVPRGGRDRAGISLTVHIALDGDALPPAALTLVECLRALAEPPAERPRLVHPVLPGGTGLRVDLDGRGVYRDGAPVRLTRREFDLLAFLGRHPRHVFSREQLLRQVWGYPPAGGERTVDVHVRRLRAKLGGDPLITTVRGVGYRLDEASQLTVTG